MTQLAQIKALGVCRFHRYKKISNMKVKRYLPEGELHAGVIS